MYLSTLRVSVNFVTSKVIFSNITVFTFFLSKLFYGLSFIVLSSLINVSVGSSLFSNSIVWFFFLLFLGFFTTKRQRSWWRRWWEKRVEMIKRGRQIGDLTSRIYILCFCLTKHFSERIRLREKSTTMFQFMSFPLCVCVFILLFSIQITCTFTHFFQSFPCFFNELFFFLFFFVEMFISLNGFYVLLLLLLRAFWSCMCKYIDINTSWAEDCRNIDEDTVKLSWEQLKCAIKKDEDG